MEKVGWGVTQCVCCIFPGLAARLRSGHHGQWDTSTAAEGWVSQAEWHNINVEDTTSNCWTLWWTDCSLQRWVRKERPPTKAFLDASLSRSQSTSTIYNLSDLRKLHLTWHHCPHRWWGDCEGSVWLNIPTYRQLKNIRTCRQLKNIRTCRQLKTTQCYFLPRNGHV